MCSSYHRPLLLSCCQLSECPPDGEKVLWLAAKSLPRSCGPEPGPEVDLGCVYAEILFSWFYLYHVQVTNCRQDFSSLLFGALVMGRQRRRKVLSTQKTPACRFVSKNCDTE